MGNYNFNQDLHTAQKTENDVGLILKYKGANTVSFNSDGDYDIMANFNGKVLTFEVKEDFKVGVTGNIAVEFESREKPSGIQTSKADYYIYALHMKNCIVEYIMFKTETLRKIIASHHYFKIVTGGDENSKTKFYLFKDVEIIKYGKLIHQIP